MNILKFFDSLHLSSSIKNKDVGRMKNNHPDMEIHQFNNCQQGTSSQVHLVKYIATIILLSIAFAGRATPSAYSEQMKSAIDRLEVSESFAEYETLAKEFEMISNLYTDKWLPKYYTAACYVFITLLEDSNLNEDQIESYQDKAEVILDDLQKDHKKESELHALIALYYVSKVMHAPLYKMLFYYWKFKSAVKRSLKLDPNNPRAIYQQIASEIGRAEELDKDLTPHCENANQLYAGWDNYSIKSELHPSWGKKELNKLLDKCK